MIKRLGWPESRRRGTQRVPRQDSHLLSDSGRAVSRFLSARRSRSSYRERIIYLSDRYPRPVRRLSPTRGGSPRGLLFGLAPDGVFRASALALGAVGSYPAFSPLPRRCFQRRGGLFSVALSVARSLHRAPECIAGLSTRVTRHRTLWSSDFPPRAEARSDPPPFQNHAQHRHEDRERPAIKPERLGNRIR